MHRYCSRFAAVVVNYIYQENSVNVINAAIECTLTYFISITCKQIWSFRARHLTGFGYMHEVRGTFFCCNWKVKEVAYRWKINDIIDQLTILSKLRGKIPHSWYLWKKETSNDTFILWKQACTCYKTMGSIFNFKG